MSVFKSKSAQLKAAYWDLFVSLVQIAIGSALVYIMMGDTTHEPWARALMWSLAYAALLGQCLNLIVWLLSPKPNIVPVIGFVLFLAVGLLQPYLVAAITLVTAVNGMLSQANKIATLRSEKP